jgi:hypothetical protein
LKLETSASARDRNIPLPVRLDGLERHSRRAAGTVTTWSIVAATVVLGLLLFGGVVAASALAGGRLELPFSFGTTSTLVDVVIGFELLFMAGLLVALLVMAVLTLVTMPGCYDRARAAALEELHESSLGLVVAEDELWQRVPERLRRNWAGVFISKHSYEGLPQHMLFCACHWESLRRIMRHQREPGRWRFSQAHQTWRMLRFFYRPGPWQIALMVLFGVVFIAHMLFIGAILLTIHGLRYLMVYARLNALAAFFIGDYES